MFKKSGVNKITSDEGYSVEVLGRTGIEYSEGKLLFFVDSEVLAEPGIVIYSNSITMKNPPNATNSTPPVKKNEIIQRVTAALKFGWPDIKIVME